MEGINCMVERNLNFDEIIDRRGTHCLKYDFAKRNVNIELDEIFISDGAKCDCGNMVDIFGENNKVAITDPVYPVYLDTNVMAGRSGSFNQNSGKYEKILYMPSTESNNFYIISYEYFSIELRK